MTTPRPDPVAAATVLLPTALVDTLPYPLSVPSALHRAATLIDMRATAATATWRAQVKPGSLPSADRATLVDADGCPLAQFGASGQHRVGRRDSDVRWAEMIEPRSGQFLAGLLRQQAKVAQRHTACGADLDSVVSADAVAIAVTVLAKATAEELAELALTETCFSA